MKKQPLLITTLLYLSITASAQSDTTRSTFWKPNPPNYSVKQAIEIESLVPMFFYGGYHVGVGYRYNKIRFRFSIINGGTYNVDWQAVKKTDAAYKRYYTTSPGFFLGYNVWKNLEVYAYYESHTFKVEQLATQEYKDIPSNDYGVGVSYQFFLGRVFYVQPGIHSYFRANNSVTFTDHGLYNIPTFELSPVIRLGFRLWRKF